MKKGPKTMTESKDGELPGGPNNVCGWVGVGISILETCRLVLEMSGDAMAQHTQQKIF